LTLFTTYILSSNTNDQNATKIDKYIADNPSCRIRKDITIKLHGKSTDLQTYRLPIELTFYNIKNGRFAAEYADLKKEKRRELDTTDLEDSKTIKKLLIEIDPRQSQILENDILQHGQRDPGIITHDGYVINGNRRRAILDNLVSLHGRSQFQFIDVARLPPDVSAQDLWKVEAGIQLARNPQLKYGPINELLKFKEGIDAGLSAKEIANELYGGFKEKDIITKLEEFKLIASYLRFIQEPNVFNKAKGIHEHFVDFQKILAEFKDKVAPKNDELVTAQHIGFQLIHDGVPARDFRKLKNVLINDTTRKELWEAQPHSVPEPSNVKYKRKTDADQKDEHTEARIIFNNCLDSDKALSEARQPEKLLRRALKNLESIDVKYCNFDDPATKQLIERVQNTLHDLCSDRLDGTYPK